MKAGLTTSVVLHAVALGLGLFTLSAPRAFEVTDVESLPVDIVPIESLTQIQQGDKKSPMKEKPAPKPTQRPDVVADAQKVGENSVDTDKKPTPEAKPKPVETADAPPPAPEPSPKPADQPKPEPVKQPEPKPAPTPEPVKEPTPPQPQPKEEPKPDQVAEAIAAESPNAEAVQLPKSAPSPEAKPKPQQPQTAKAPDRKEPDKPVKPDTSSRQKSDEKSFNADEIAALLSKEKAAGGGAKRSTEQASLGGDKSNNKGAKLSQSEMDALRGQIQRCWNIPAGAADAQNLRVSVKFKLDRNGAVEGGAEVISGGGSSGVERAAAESARRAVLKCSPYNLPADKYDAWADVIVNFDPSEMF